MSFYNPPRLPRLNNLNKSTGNWLTMLDVYSKDPFKEKVKELESMYTDNPVKLAQAYLEYIGYDIGKEGIDGISVASFETWQAIKKFQKQAGLPATGYITGFDDPTLKKMKQAVSNWTKYMDIYRDPIKEAQNLLLKMGFDINGGEYTTKVVITFQDMVGLEPTGKIDDETLSHMRGVVGKNWKIIDNILVLNPELKQSNNNNRIKPVYGGRISSYFGNRTDPFTGEIDFHSGLDIASSINTPLYAVESGLIVVVSTKTGYGNHIFLKGDNGFTYRYAHMNGFSSEIKPEVGVETINGKEKYLGIIKRVEQGDFIGYMGSTGRSTGSHLHFDMWLTKSASKYYERGIYKDPLDFINF